MLVSNVLWLILQSQVEIKLPVGWRISKWSHKTPYWLNDTHGMFQETTALLHIQKRKWVVNTEYKRTQYYPEQFHATFTLPIVSLAAVFWYVTKRCVTFQKTAARETTLSIVHLVYPQNFAWELFWGTQSVLWVIWRQSIQRSATVILHR